MKLVTLLVKFDSNTVGLTSGEIQCKATSVITRSSDDEAIKKKTPIKQSKDFFLFMSNSNTPESIYTQMHVYIVHERHSVWLSG